MPKFKSPCNSCCQKVIIKFLPLILSLFPTREISISNDHTLTIKSISFFTQKKTFKKSYENWAICRFICIAWVFLLRLGQVVLQNCKYVFGKRLYLCLITAIRMRFSIVSHFSQFQNKKDKVTNNFITQFSFLKRKYSRNNLVKFQKSWHKLQSPNYGI